MRLFAALLLFALTAAPAAAQESQFQSDLRREGDDVRSSCNSGFGVKQLVGCIVTLATDDPFHVALGSLPPLNGTGYGIAFAEHYTPNERWRLSWNADTVLATSGSWRAGGYMKFIYVPGSAGISVIRPGSARPPRPGQGSEPARSNTAATSLFQGSQPASVAITEYPVFNLYAQAISLDTLLVADGQGAFSERQTIVGGNAIYPLGRHLGAIRGLHPSLVGSVNGRFLNLQSSALNLSERPSFAQFEEGIRIKPSVLDDRLQLNYLFDFQQFAASADSHSSFHRWNVDLKHEFPLYRTVSSTGPKDSNGPDECRESVGSSGCPPVSYSSNRGGTLGFRFLATRSSPGSDSSVPFYFQPTLGGSDINGQRLLAGYDDYKFRGPNLIALQESIEHSLWGPIGIYLLAEQGKVTPEGADFGSGSLARSFAVGFTVRAGGFPLMNLSFAWGTDSHHVIGSIDSSLLGGSSRPSLY
jgi:hypothetical protein